jgi:hypothetical protein
MTHRYLKCAGLAAVLSGFSSFALAQTPPTPPPPPLGPLANSTNGPQNGGVKSNNVTAQAYSLGWNFRICSSSYWYSPDNVHFYVFANNTDGSSFWYSSDVNLASPQNQFLAACEHAKAGYWIYITNTVTLTYNRIWVYYP